jgi:hypothetical protein
MQIKTVMDELDSGKKCRYYFRFAREVWINGVSSFSGPLCLKVSQFRIRRHGERDATTCIVSGTPWLEELPRVFPEMELTRWVSVDLKNESVARCTVTFGIEFQATTAPSGSTRCCCILSRKAIR